MRLGRTVLVAIAALGAAVVGCRQTVRFPDEPADQEALPGGGLNVQYDINGDGRTDYVQTTDGTGRVIALGFDDDHDGQIDESVDLRRIDRSAVPHLVIILDGPPLRVAEAMRKEGRFRLFPPPTRVISCFPAMTDLGMNQLLGTGPSAGYEARYYDRRENRVVGGTSNYLAADNSPWVARVDYRIGFGRDGDAYLNPAALFRDELAGMAKVFEKAGGPGTVIAYTVGTTGLTTVKGEEAARDYLLQIDRFCEQIVHDRRGRVSLTITGDHGHNLMAGERVSFKRYLEKRGWRITQSLKGDDDAIYVEYGLVTYAAFATRSPRKLADDLAGHEAVDLVLRPDGFGGVLVRRRNERARVMRVAGQGNSASGGLAGYRYDLIAGDPLKLVPVLDRLRAAGKVSSDGVIDDRALFQATGAHEYPDPLQRIWEAFNGLVLNPADVIASLKDPWYHGSAFFDAMITEASTHGALGRPASETFVLSTRAPLPPLMRQPEVLPSLGVVWARPADAPDPPDR